MGTYTTTLLYMCVIFSVGLTDLNQNNTYEGNGNPRLPTSVTATPTDVVTECLTPNNETGYCVELKQCSILLKQISNRDAWEFIRASICKTSRTGLIPKVCCGHDSNFRNVENILPTSCGYQTVVTVIKIQGGVPAQLGEFPWMALILHENKDGDRLVGCTGFLIHPKFILTAAHCTSSDSISNRGPIVSVLLGEHDIHKNMDCNKTACYKNTQTRGIDKIVTHPSYDPHNFNYYNDIAIIMLKSNARMTDFVKPICLLEDDSQIPVSYFICGWGRTENASYNNVKLIAEIPPFDNVDCIEKLSSHNVNLLDTQICAGGQRLKDTCTGDSGGPLMIKKGLVWYAAGIVSFGLSCGEKGLPGVYTNIPKFLPWIKSEVAKALNI